GSGTQIQDVNRVLKQHAQMQKMMKKVTAKGGMQKMMRAMGGMRGMGGSGPFGGGGGPFGGGMAPMRWGGGRKGSIGMERLFEQLMYASRWIMAPIYLGLSLLLVALGVKFFQEVIHLVPIIFSIKEVDLILVALSLIDIALVGGLIVMVMFSGYENFVS